MKKRILTLVFVGVLGVSTLAMTACGSKKASAEQPTSESTSEAASDNASDATTEAGTASDLTSDDVTAAIEEQINAGVENLEVPESTGDLTAIVGEWKIAAIVDSNGEETELNDDAINAVYTFNEDATCILNIAGINTYGVYGIDENGTITMRTTSADIIMNYDAESDKIEVEDTTTDTGMYTYLVRQ